MTAGIGPRRFLPLLVTTLLVGALCAGPGLAAGPLVNGAYGWTYTVTVPAATAPNDLHVTFTGTGGTIDCVTVAPAGATSVTGGNTINVDWSGGTPGAGKLAPGTVVTLTFRTDHSPVGVASGTWTNDGTNVGNAGNGQIATDVPALPTWGLLLSLGAALAIGASILTRRG